MSSSTSYFFCGIGGSGMLPLALILRARGHDVSGSDRALDQGRTPEKFAFLKRLGIRLYPQDGSGIVSSRMVVVTSAAVENTVPDVRAAIRVGAMRLTRAEVLSKMFNAAETSIGIAGTSGKSTVTGMVGWMLHAAGLHPTVMNGAVMKNFASKEAPCASAMAEGDRIFVSEIDESDGSIARYMPKIAVLNNVGHDHKSMEELRELFGTYLAKAYTAVVNIDNEEAAEIAGHLMENRLMRFSLENPQADLYADDIVPAPGGIAMRVHGMGETARVRLGVPGRHNAANALAAMGAVIAAGVPFKLAAETLEHFSGIKRRMEVVGDKRGITVIDDFAHNPDKIAATLGALHEFPGRLLMLFQPHGFGPLKLLMQEFADTFAALMGEQDVLAICDPVYFGGTADRTVSAADLADLVSAAGRKAFHMEKREDCGGRLAAMARSGDRIVIMGARDDTLSDFAASLLDLLAQAPAPEPVHAPQDVAD